MSPALVEHSLDDLPIVLELLPIKLLFITYLSCHRLSPSYYAFITSLSTAEVLKIMVEQLVHPGLASSYD